MPGKKESACKLECIRHRLIKKCMGLTVHKSNPTATRSRANNESARLCAKGWWGRVDKTGRG